MSAARSSGPPRWALRFLQWYCKPVFLESIEGDLYELFELRIQTKGEGSARRRFVWDVLRFFRLKYIKGLENLKGLNQIDMWKNYFKISLRNLWGQRFFTFINTAGLAVGIACCLLIMLFIKHELSYDKFYSDHGRIYRVALNSRGPYTPARLGVQLQADYPQVESYTRISGLFEMTFVLGDKVIKEQGGIIADSTFFDVFNVKMLEGDPSSALIEPNSVVLTKSLADKYFPEGGAVGQIIRSSGESVKVTGVVTDPPTNTHMPFKFIGSMPREDWVMQGWWTGNNFFTYIKLSDGYSKVQMESNMVDFVKKYIGPELIAFSGHATFEDYLAAGNSHFFSLHPMADIHLHYPRFSLHKGGDINNIYIFASVAFFILLIACINYVNLATARSARRSKEVGVRKVLGALKGELTRQFLVESFIVSLVSALVALTISYLTLPYFNELAGKSFTSSDLITSETILWLTILFAVIGFLAGAYPALMQASMKPVQALRGQFSSGKSGGLLRKGLVSFQFAVSIFLVISTLVVFVQLDYINNQKLGMDISQVLAIRGGNALGDKALYFKDKLRENASVEEVAISNLYPSQPHYDWSYKTVEENPGTYGFSNLFTDDNYVKTLGIELVQGRFFDKSFATDTAAIVINEAVVRELGWAEPLGQKLDRGEEGQFTVIGVVKDYNYYTLKNEVRGLVIRYNPKIHAEYCSYLVKINGNYEGTLNEIENLWAELSPEEPFDYTFLNESFAALYESEKRFGQVFTVFAMLAIFIACLGLFALAAFTLERRHKEIAIRKVLGASVTSITTLVLTDFTKLVIAGSLIAVPLSFYLMDLWLQEFAYRMKLVPLLFIVPVLLITLVAWLTVIYQSVRTASSNPVNALKQE